MANVSKLLYSTVADEAFLFEIDPEDEAKSALLGARTKIRKELKEAFAKSSRDLFGKAIEPRFFTQGSYSYKTLNDPAWPPDQQMDLDDGCYLPMSFVKEARPSQASSLFFEFVDGVLEDLARKEGWKYRKKNTCCRLVISQVAHIDVPLYAIPDSEFLALESAMVAKAVAFDRARPDNWQALPSNSVLLAHRKEDWKVSDPRKIKRWFLDAVDIYGEKLRRVCRYLKAWRDYHRPALDEVSSILLMVCAWKAFEERRRAFVPDREDQVLLMVLEKLPGYLSSDVANPADPDENVNRVSGEGREVAILHAQDFAARLRGTIESGTDPIVAISEMRRALGQRVPNRPDLVSVAEAARAAVLSQPRKEVSAPVVGRSQSG